MTPLPAALGGVAELVAWRLDRARYASTWDSGEGAYHDGGRWNSVGRRVVYCSLDPSTTILEKAVHAGFAMLDVVAHVLTSLTLADPSRVLVVQPSEVPNPAWLGPGAVSAGQQAFGDALLAEHPFVVVPSTVSVQSWNLIFDPVKAAGLYARRTQEAFALDGRLDPAIARRP